MMYMILMIFLCLSSPSVIYALSILSSSTSARTNVEVVTLQNVPERVLAGTTTKKTCPFFEKTCDDETCIRLIDLCPGECGPWERKCLDGTCVKNRDPCPGDCPKQERKCRDGTCVKKYHGRCLEEPCPVDEPLMCNNSRAYCYNKDMRCNNQAFCPDRDDEQGCFIGIDTKYPGRHKLLWGILAALGFTVFAGLVYCYKHNKSSAHGTADHRERSALNNRDNANNRPVPNETRSVTIPLQETTATAPNITTLSGPPAYQEVINTDDNTTAPSCPSKEDLPSYEAAIEMETHPVRSDT